MFEMFKYADIISLENTLTSVFENISPTRQIALLPPVLKKIGVNYVLAYLVVARPNIQDENTGITRPIGFVLRHRKNKKLLQVATYKEFEFCFDKNNFSHIYYNLGENRNYLPNQTQQTEENFRLCLETLYKANKSINLFGVLNQNIYDEYKKQLAVMFPASYLEFFEDLEENQILPVNNEILKARLDAQSAYLNRLEYNYANFENDVYNTKKDFEKYATTSLVNFVQENILEELAKQDACPKILFYAEFGKILKNLTNEKNYKCYNPNLINLVREKNQHRLIGDLRIEIIKKYARAITLQTKKLYLVNEICQLLLTFMETMLKQEQENKVTEKSRQIIGECIELLNEKIDVIDSKDVKSKFDNYTNDLCLDYYEAVNVNSFSAIYYGYYLLNN